ncbi:hypothetical protein [Haliea sp.]|uniref:hypothetical protein n=1 Tax=Haliea sp. TaxID=1932666 RepID=UPI003528DCFF
MSRQQPAQSGIAENTGSSGTAHGAPTDQAVGAGLLIGLGALTLAAVLIGLLLPYWGSPPAPRANDTPPVEAFNGRAFSPTRAESSQIEGTAQVIRTMLGNEAVFSITTRVPLQQYPFIRLDLTGGASLRYFLFWRTAEQPEQQFFAPLAGAGRGVSWHAFPDPALWNGTATTVAIGAFGNPAGAPITLRSLGFHGDSRRARFASAWTLWHAGGSWPASGINRYMGTPLQAGAVFPVAWIGLWAFLGTSMAVLWVLWRRVGRRTAITAALLTIFLPWLLLDRLWQAQLQRQVTLTDAAFGDRTQAEKHAAEADADLQDYATRIRGMLATPDARVVLLHASEGHNHDRLRLQFHLLPANVYNYGSRLLAPGEMRRGDYVLTLGALPGFQYSPREQLLSDGRHVYRARRIDAHPLGNLYLISGYAGTASTP